MFYEVQSKWNVEEHMLILKITASVPLMKIEQVDSQIQNQMMAKMAYLVIGAAKYSGKPVEVPVFGHEPNHLVITAGISFHTKDNLKAYSEECKKKLNNGI